MNVHRAIASASSLAIIIAAGCSGTNAPPLPASSPSTSPASISRATGMATFGFQLASSKLDARGYRHRSALSLETASVTVTLESVDGVAQTGATPAVINLLPNSPSCMPDPTGKAIVVCSVAVTEPAGTDTFSLAAFDEPGASGNRLSAGTASASIPAGGSAAVPLTFEGIVARVRILATLPAVAAGVESAEQIFVQAQDAGGASIVGDDPFVSPIVLTLADPAHLVHLSATTIANPSVMATATVDARDVSSGSATIGANVAGVNATQIVPATIVVDNDRNWTNGTTFAYTGSSTTVASGPHLTTTTTRSSNTSHESFTNDGATIVRNVTTATTAAGSNTASTEVQRYQFQLIGDFSTTHLDLANYTFTDAYGGNGSYVYQGEDIIDEFPERAGETFPNSNAFVETYRAAANDPIPNTTYQNAPNGAYSYTEQFSNGDSLAVAADPQRGSTYAFSGGNGSGVSYAIASPGPSNAPGIAVVETVASPAPSATPVPAFTAPNWYPATPDTTQAFQIDGDANLGPNPVPSACGEAPVFPATANLIHENFFSLDPVAGETLTEEIDTYVVPGTGVVCRSNLATENLYYDSNEFTNTAEPLATLFAGKLLETFTTQTYSGLQAIGTTTASQRASIAMPNAQPRAARTPANPRPPLLDVDRVREAAEGGS